jgi:trk system potassium uptake protein TrkH
VNFRPPLRFLGRLTLVLAVAELAPFICCLAFGEAADARAFLISALVAALAGGTMMLLGAGGGELYRREGILIVVGGWILASIFGALPYMLTGVLTGPVDALFESASGFTTTGASVMSDIEAAGHGLLFWRSFTQWLGGMGIIVLFVALLPELGPGARFLYKMEVPGPTAEALQPRIRTTAMTLWKIYLGFTVAETLLLKLAGMSLYGALTHTFSTMSTGGFSPRNASVAAFDSPWVHLIIIVFMIFAGTNFSLFFGMRRRKNWNLFRDSEFRIYIWILGAATALLTWDLLRSGTYTQPFRALLDSAFQAASILTTTGFATADFATWPVFGRMLLVVLMFVGGCAGSTSGSMKVMRMAIGVKSALREVRLIFSPNTILAVFVRGKAVPDSVVRSVAGFFILYLSTWGVGALLLSIGAPDLITAATASAASLGNIRPGLRAVGPTENFALFNAAEKSLMVLLMWLGRLEVYSIAALFTRAYWRP